jgi:hypothetical protein
MYTARGSAPPRLPSPDQTLRAAVRCPESLADPSETEVTLIYGWSAVPPSIWEYIQFPPFGPEHSPTLHHLAELAAPTSRA